LGKKAYFCLPLAISAFLVSYYRPKATCENERVTIYLSSLKKTILMHLAVNISEKEIEHLRRVFVKIDSDGNGMITRE
jgi:hypothetical protein